MDEKIIMSEELRRELTELFIIDRGRNPQPGDSLVSMKDLEEFRENFPETLKRAAKMGAIPKGKAKYWAGRLKKTKSMEEFIDCLREMFPG